MSKKKRPPLAPQTETQSRYLMLIESSPLVFALGPAGTGKTLIPAYMASDLLQEGQLQQIILVRPLIETGRDIGALPGEEYDKIRPYFEPLLEHFRVRLGTSHVENLIRNEKINLQPIEFVRGMTYNDTWIIIDEAENVTPAQMKAILTRVGKYSKVIVNGDPKQCDLRKESSGLLDAVDKLCDIEEVGFIEFSTEDIVRSGLTRKIVEAYEGFPCEG